MEVQIVSRSAAFHFFFFVLAIVSDSDAEDLVVFLPGHESTVHLDTSTTVLGGERVSEEDD